MSTGRVLLVLALSLAGPGLAAASGPVTQVEGTTVIADAVERASPCVVNIVTRAPGAQHRAQPDELLFPFAPPDALGPRRGQGSGLIIDKAGLVLTAQHVVDAAAQIDVTLAQGSF